MTRQVLYHPLLFMNHLYTNKLLDMNYNDYYIIILIIFFITRRLKIWIV